MKTVIIALTVFLSVSEFISAWEGYDYETGIYIEIEEDNLVRRGEEIEYYDWDEGEYRTGQVQDIERTGSGVEVEVYDYESGDYRTFEMDEE